MSTSLPYQTLEIFEILILLSLATKTFITPSASHLLLMSFHVFKPLIKNKTKQNIEWDTVKDEVFDVT